MRKTVIATALLVSTVSLFAQKSLDVTVKQVNDRRTNGHFAQLTISVELPGVRSADVAASRVLVSSAVDETGRNLIDAEAGEPQLEPNHRMSMLGEEAAQPATVSITLENPDRKATSVKEVRGEIELYMPSKDPNSVAEVTKFLATSGKPLAHRALKANGVDITLLGATQVTAEKKRLADLKRKEAKESGFEGEGLEEYIKSFIESLLRVEESDLLVRIKDPNKRIQQISYVDAAGEVKRISMRDEEGITYFSTWGDKPQPDWKLQVSMRTTKNITRHAFALANVPLP